MVLGFGDGKVRLLGLETGKVLRRDVERSDVVYTPVYSPDGRSAAGNLAFQRAVVELFGQVRYPGSLPARTMMFNPKREQILVSEYSPVGQPGVVSVWPRGGSEPGLRLTHSDFVTSLKVHPEGQLALTASSDGRAALWNLNQRGSPSPVQTFEHNYPIEWADFAPDPNLLVTLGSLGLVQIWHIPSGLPLGPPLPSDIDSLPTFTSDGSLVTLFQGQARLWNLQPWARSRAETVAGSQ